MEFLHVPQLVEVRQGALSFGARDGNTGLFPRSVRNVAKPRPPAPPSGAGSPYPVGLRVKKMADWLWKVRRWTVSVEHTRISTRPLPPGESGMIRRSESFSGVAIISRPWRTVRRIMDCVGDRSPVQRSEIEVSIKTTFQSSDGDTDTFESSQTYVLSVEMGFFICNFWGDPGAKLYYPELKIGGLVGSGTEVNEWGSPKSSMTMDGIDIPLRSGVAGSIEGSTATNGSTAITLTPVYF